MDFYLPLQEEDNHVVGASTVIRQYLKGTSGRRWPQCISSVRDWL